MPEDYRFYEDIYYLSDTGIISEFPDGRFSPDASVTRAQAKKLKEDLLKKINKAMQRT